MCFGSINRLCVEVVMMRFMTAGLAVVAVGLIVVAQGTGADTKKAKPDVFGKITDVKKADAGAKGLGTLTVHTMKKGDQAGKDITVKIGMKTEILKGTGKKTAPETATFNDLKAGEGVAVWLAEGKPDVAARIVFRAPKK
jgi:hypothetical protein